MVPWAEKSRPIIFLHYRLGRLLLKADHGRNTVQLLNNKVVPQNLRIIRVLQNTGSLVRERKKAARSRLL